MTVIAEVERYLRNTGMAPSRLGRLAANDVKLVEAMRSGRVIGDRLAGRVLAWMAAHPRGDSSTLPTPKRKAVSAPAGAAELRASIAAEASASGTRRNLARRIAGVAKPLAIEPAPTVAERISTALVEQPGDLVATVKRRWPVLWAGVLASARAAQVAPGAHLMTVIEAGLSAVDGEGR